MYHCASLLLIALACWGRFSLEMIGERDECSDVDKFSSEDCCYCVLCVYLFPLRPLKRCVRVCACVCVCVCLCARLCVKQKYDDRPGFYRSRSRMHVNRSFWKVCGVSLVWATMCTTMRGATARMRARARERIYGIYFVDGIDCAYCVFGIYGIYCVFACIYCIYGLVGIYCIFACAGVRVRVRVHV